MKKIVLLITLAVVGVTFAQVGVNAVNPKATLDIQVKTNNTTTNEGILIPRVSKTRTAAMATPEESTLVYINDVVYTSGTDANADARVVNITTKGFHYYDGTTWQPMQKTSPKLDYILTADGTSFIQWLNPFTQTIDMNSYPDMEDVTYIGDILTSDATVQNFIMKEGVKVIGSRAFLGNPDIKFTFASTLEKIGKSAFEGNQTITTLNLPNATTIERYAFYGNTLLASVNLPKARTIGDSAFSNSTSLTNVNLPEAETIGGSAFSYTSLTSVSLPKAKTIGGSAFSYTSLTSVSLPLATTIEGGAFSRTSLTSVSLPKAETIGGFAFKNSSQLSSITLGPNTTLLGAGAFRDIAPNCELTIEATIPPRITYDASNTTFYSNRTIIIKVPSASVQAYKDAGYPSDRVVGY